MNTTTQKKQVLCFLALLLLGSLRTEASDSILESTEDPMVVKMHGFVSQGYLLTTRNNYLGSSEKGTFKLTEIGVNFTKPVTDKLTAGAQLFANSIGVTGNFDAKFDWFYLDYRWKNWLGFRTGRIKIPFGLYNEVQDAPSARAPILLPQSIYPITGRNYLLAQNGVEVYGYADLESSGALDYRLYAGTIFIDVPPVTSTTTIVTSFDVPYLAGGRLFWETPIEGFKIGGSGQVLQIDADVLVSGVTSTVKIPAFLWVGSTQYIVDDWLFAAEYSRWHTQIESDNITRFPNTKTTSERYYAMANYRLNDLLRPSLYYSFLRPDLNQKGGFQSRQHDVAFTMGFDLNENWILKLETHYMNGTGGLSSARNGGQPLAALKEHWGIFMAKTTVFF